MLGMVVQTCSGLWSFVMLVMLPWTTTTVQWHPVGHRTVTMSVRVDTERCLVVSCTLLTTIVGRTARLPLLWPVIYQHQHCYKTASCQHRIRYFLLCWLCNGSSSVQVLASTSASAHSRMAFSMFARTKSFAGRMIWGHTGDYTLHKSLTARSTVASRFLTGAHVRQTGRWSTHPQTIYVCYDCGDSFTFGLHLQNHFVMKMTIELQNVFCGASCLTDSKVRVAMSVMEKSTAAALIVATIVLRLVSTLPESDYDGEIATSQWWTTWKSV